MQKFGEGGIEFWQNDDVDIYFLGVFSEIGTLYLIKKHASTPQGCLLPDWEELQELMDYLEAYWNYYGNNNTGKNLISNHEIHFLGIK